MVWSLAGIIYGELKMIDNGVTMTYFKTLIRHSPGNNELSQVVI